jgi:hypothetical protein
MQELAQTIVRLTSTAARDREAARAAAAEAEAAFKRQLAEADATAQARLDDIRQQLQASEVGCRDYMM